MTARRHATLRESMRYCYIHIPIHINEGEIRATQGRAGAPFAAPACIHRRFSCGAWCVGVRRINSTITKLLASEPSPSRTRVYRTPGAGGRQQPLHISLRIYTYPPSLSDIHGFIYSPLYTCLFFRGMFVSFKFFLFFSFSSSLLVLIN